MLERGRHDDWYSDLLRWTFSRFGVLGLIQRSHLRALIHDCLSTWEANKRKIGRTGNAFGLWLGINGTAMTGDRAIWRLITEAWGHHSRGKNLRTGWPGRKEERTTTDGGLTGLGAGGDRQTFSFASQTKLVHFNDTRRTQNRVGVLPFPE